MRIPLSLLPMWRVAAEENMRYAMTGLRVERGESGNLILVACDGRRLLVAEVPGSEVPELPARPLVPRQLVKSADGIVKKLRNGTAELSFSEGLAVLEVPGPEGPLRLSAVPAVGKFPDWRGAVKASGRPVLEATAEQRKACVPVRLGVSLFRGLLEALDCMGLDTVDFYFPVDAVEGNGAGVTFRAREEGSTVSVYGILMPLSGSHPPPP